MTTYKHHDQYSAVYLDGKLTGHILRTIGGEWFYSPKGKENNGALMPSKEAVMLSLEGDSK